MKVYRIAAVCLVLTILTAAAAAQSVQKPLTKEILAGIVSAKGATSPFVLLTPKDLEGYSVPGGDPCTQAMVINIGQTVDGSLALTDCQLDDFSYADFYAFEGTISQQITINMSSSVFDTYLGLANLAGTFVVEDDDGGGGTNSRIAVSLPETGTYIILANSAFANTFGQYTLSLAGSAVCTYSLEPSTVQIPGAGGTFTFIVITQPGCYWSTNYDIYNSILESVTSGGMGSGTVSYRVTPNNTGANRSDIIRVGGKIFTVNQTFLVCTYAISATGVDHSADSVTSEFMMITPEGCPWMATRGQDDWWISHVSGLQRGPGPVRYIAAANNGANRIGTITVAGLTFSIRQAGRNCTYAVSPMSFQVLSTGQNGTISIDTQPGCTWSFSAGYSWITFVSTSYGSGSGSVTYRAYANHYPIPRTWHVYFTGHNTFTLAFSQLGSNYRTPFDFDGDGKADLSVYRPSEGSWYLQRSAAGYSVTSWGLAEDIAAPGDFDRDRIADFALFRPSEGNWYIAHSNGTFTVGQFGLPGDIPVPADYDGDGTDDRAVFRPSNSTWYILRSTGGVTTQTFGISGDHPVPGDYDGDMKADLSVFRPSNGTWYRANSGNGNFIEQQWGLDGDIPVNADYDGDNKQDFAVFRPSTASWYILNSTNGSYNFRSFGLTGDVPVPGDYDGDGSDDIAVFRNGFWYIIRSAQVYTETQFGLPGDTAIPGKLTQ